MSFKEILRKRAKTSQSGRVIGKRSPYEILGTPLVTEKAYKMVENDNIYTFRVDSEANKIDVKESIQSIYNITPLSVRVVNVPKKGRMYRKLVRRGYKKALVTLKQGDKIELAA